MVTPEVVLPIDPVADAAQPGEVAQVLRRRGSAGHLRDRATSRRRCLAPLATGYDRHAVVHRGGLVRAAVLLWLTYLGDTS
jgi:hypothetical protein